MAEGALFEGMVFNEAGEPVRVVYIGGDASYVVPDGSFLRHVDARHIDDAVIAQMKEQITSHKDLVIQQMLQMLGKADIFTKAALDASIRNMDQEIRSSDASQWQPLLQMFGFRVVVDIHGDIVELVYPEQSDDE